MDNIKKIKICFIALIFIFLYCLYDNKELFSEIKNEVYLNLSEQETSLMAKGIYKFDLDS